MPQNELKSIFLESITSSQLYRSPVFWLTSVLILQLTFVAVVIVTVDSSEEKVRIALERQVRLERLQGDILHLDEVLTMSARMSAASGDLRWEDRYKLYEPKLEEAILEALALLPSDKLKGMEETNTANTKLVEMEIAAFEAVRKGNKKEAQKLLFSPVYEQAKLSYALGLGQRLQLLDTLVEDLINTQKQRVKIIQWTGLVGWGFLLIVCFVVLKYINQWQNRLTKTQRDLQTSQKFLKEKVHAMARELTKVEHKERERIAKILHDQLQQILVAARLHIQMLPDTDSRLRTQNLIDEAIHSSRTLTMTLNPPVLMARGFFEALEWLSTWMKENYNLNITLNISSTDHVIEKEAQIVAFDSIRELLFNVVKHAGVSSATLIYSVENNKIVITVKDKGVGFDLKETLSGQQFGLLYIIRRIELIGGSINIHTNESKGTKIVLTFPMETPNRSTGTQNSIRVLLVDDHAIVREGIRFILEQQEDISVIGEASNVSEVLELIQKQEPDIILMDISLGENQPNGLEVTKILRKKGFEQGIIVLSSYDLPHYRESMKELGVSDYLIKGDDTNKVFESIRSSARISM